MTIDEDPDQAEIWKIEIKPLDYAALGLIGFAVFFGVVLVAYAIGGLLGVWQ